MALSLKRASISMDSTSPYPGTSSICSKRQCLRSSPILSNCQNLLRDRNGHSSSSSSSSSEEEEDEENDDNSEIVSVKASKNNKLRKQRRNQRSIKRSLGVSNLSDSKLTKAVSQYSDDEDEDDNCQDSSLQNRKRYFMKARKSVNLNFDDDRVSHFIPTNENHSSYSSSYSTKESNCVTHNNGKIVMNDSILTSPTNMFSNRNNINRSHNTSSNNKPFSISNFGMLSPPHGDFGFGCNKARGHILPDSDFTARNRCFDYLVGAIDDVWARYCDATAYGEEQVYGFENGNSSNNKSFGINGNNKMSMMNSSNMMSTNSSTPQTPTSVIASSDDEEGYNSEISATTSLTDYESEYEINKKSSRVCEAPSNVRLQESKDRLIKAKYYLQEFVDSDNVQDCLSFWKRWDMIKYGTIELVEDDDDDDVVENTIDQLEVGRYSGSLSA
ncbi:hypothetical protein BVG19_g714 [[Candida] boidinii]|nr:hypothetical protein BVG19_g714 [[Candida] boidinii]OWB49278.1 transaminase activity protein [[Candida] boidinii]